MAKRIYDWASPDRATDGRFIEVAEPGEGGGGGSLDVGSIVQDATPNVGDWSFPADQTKPTLIFVECQVTLLQGDIQAEMTLEVGTNKVNTAVARFGVSRDAPSAGASVGEYTYVGTLAALLAPGDSWSVTGPTGQCQVNSVTERTL